MEREVAESPELLANGAESLSVDLIKVQHVHEILFLCQHHHGDIQGFTGTHDDTDGRNYLTDDRRGVVLSFGDVVHGFREHNDALSKYDEGEKTTSLIEICALEAETSPLTRADEYRQSFEDCNHVPDNVSIVDGCATEAEQYS